MRNIQSVIGAYVFDAKVAIKDTFSKDNFMLFARGTGINLFVITDDDLGGSNSIYTRKINIP